MNKEKAHSILEERQSMMTKYRHLFTEDEIQANGEAILSIEKDIAKEPFVNYNWFNFIVCPKCRKKLDNMEYTRCTNCGQLLDMEKFNRKK